MKQFKKVIFLIFSFIVLSSGVAFCEPAVQPETSTNTVTEQVNDITADNTQNDINDVPETIPEKNIENLKKIKESPMASKFTGILFFILLAAALVILYIAGLKLYKRTIGKIQIADASPKETLASPEDFKSAINLFLGKTDD